MLLKEATQFSWLIRTQLRPPPGLAVSPAHAEELRAKSPACIPSSPRQEAQQQLEAVAGVGAGVDAASTVASKVAVAIAATQPAGALVEGVVRAVLRVECELELVLLVTIQKLSRVDTVLSVVLLAAS